MDKIGKLSNKNNQDWDDIEVVALGECNCDCPQWKDDKSKPSAYQERVLEEMGQGTKCHITKYTSEYSSWT